MRTTDGGDPRSGTSPQASETSGRKIVHKPMLTLKHFSEAHQGHLSRICIESFLTRSTRRFKPPWLAVSTVRPTHRIPPPLAMANHRVWASACLLGLPVLNAYPQMPGSPGNFPFPEPGVIPQQPGNPGEFPDPDELPGGLPGFPNPNGQLPSGANGAVAFSSAFSTVVTVVEPTSTPDSQVQGSGTGLVGGSGGAGSISQNSSSSQGTTNSQSAPVIVDIINLQQGALSVPSNPFDELN